MKGLIGGGTIKDRIDGELSHPDGVITDWTKDQIPEAHYELFRDLQRRTTQSSVTALRSPRQHMDVGIIAHGTKRREAPLRYAPS